MSDTPAQLGPYKPQQLLATGAQANVWLAIGRTPEGPRQVALKVPRTDDGRARCAAKPRCSRPRTIRTS